jgi:methylenetetrahydrofolate reductase (NADPH)
MTAQAIEFEGISPVLQTVPRASADPAAAIAEFVRGFSIEVTRPSLADIDMLAGLLPAGTHVYISAVPGKSPLDDVAGAAALRAHGLEPVPHIAVRNYPTIEALDDVLARFADQAGVRRVLVIAGDRDKPAGSLRGAVEAIDGGVLRRRGIVEIGISGYPDGHPRIAQHELDRTLAAKVEAAAQTGVGVTIVTQFGFEAAPILAWIARLRAFGIEHPVRIGLPGPTSLATLLRYAQRCGVKASAQGLARHSGLVRQMFGMSMPDVLVRTLAEARAGGKLGDVGLHFFSFGGAAATARWVGAVADGRIALDRDGGFKVLPPG